MTLPNQVNPLFTATSSPYTVGRSLRFRASASAFLDRTPSVASNQQRWTWSVWLKRGVLTTSSRLFAVGGTSGAPGQGTAWLFQSNDTFLFQNDAAASMTFTSTAVYRDTGAWYHLVLALDTTQATANNRILFYVNGVLVSGTYSGTIAQNASLDVNSTQNHRFGQHTNNQYFDGYMAEINFIDGQQLTPTSFGAYDTNGVWQPKKYGGTYGTNGYYLPFSNTSSTTTLVQDSSGNGNNWTPNNISLTAGVTYDSMIDSPTVSASSSNYDVLNPLDKNSALTLNNGNLSLSSSTGAWNACGSTFGINSSFGKIYAECTYTTVSSTGTYEFGLRVLGLSNISSVEPFGDTNGLGLLWNSTSVKSRTNNVETNNTTVTTVAGDVYQVAFDAAAGNLWLGRNNTWLGGGNPSTGTTPTYTGVTNSAGYQIVAAINNGGAGTPVLDINFGQRPFTYTPPTNYKALNTYNMPAATINNGALYNAATLYTGTGTTLSVNNGNNNTIGTTFAPNLVWIKSRSGAFNHELYDTVRGATLRIDSNLTNAESTSTLGLTSFNSNGFTQGGQTETGANGSTYDSWQWKAGTASGSSNTSGSITSTVSADTTAGFSVVTFTANGTAGATVGHGLGVAPNLILGKNRSNVVNWNVYHSSLGATQYLELNTTAAAGTSSAAWNNTAPTSTVVTLGGSSGAINTTGNAVLYCFAAVAGYSAFGKYTGNGAADGAFVYLGFRPRWVMIKRSDSTGAWNIFDTSLNPYNLSTQSLVANTNAAENTGTTIVLDILSNGMKMRSSDAALNSGTLIYAAFAENPLNYARAR